ncbi:MAG: formate dehydrogenase accessory sulfurtransferase FdhD [Gammaproteobacteria bacterium]|nr:formate dehydrogenase accessory sulfurtransferase FdhD [Gammaproteobacteria bacterium]NNF61177.1 formate dehydrogenase accessory sulfurtransferase FdhD [Gammaproteobacteria bacterium]NNM19872.1 formate dehydrogenase accessory sulfurtransferase FdhD [Gammaproteobacteria bacterium]
MSMAKPLAVEKVTEAGRSTQPDAVAVEEPLEIRLGYSDDAGRTARSISITMRTPGNDIELALGFLYGEGIINDAAAVNSAEHCGPPAPDSGLHNIVRVELADGENPDIARLERHFYSTSSCGVCGKSSLAALSLDGSVTLEKDACRFSAGSLTQLPAKLRAQQATFAATGGLHAAALFDLSGEIQLVREDVGRHNAVDKVVGSLLQARRLPAVGHGLLVSGRASFELMQKALRAGIPLLAAVGAPSSLAVSLAAEYGMTLVGFLRDGRFNIYSGERRVGQ